MKNIFSMCKDKNGNHPCAWCKPERQDKCKALILTAKRYSDDPRNAAIDSEVRQ